MSNKLEELMNTAKINELLHKKELEEKNKNGIIIALAIIGAVAAVAAIAYAVFLPSWNAIIWTTLMRMILVTILMMTLLSSQIQHQKQRRLILATEA